MGTVKDNKLIDKQSISYVYKCNGENSVLFIALTRNEGAKPHQILIHPLSKHVFGVLVFSFTG